MISRPKVSCFVNLYLKTEVLVLRERLHELGA